MKKLLTISLTILLLLCMFACDTPSTPSTGDTGNSNGNNTPVVDDSSTEKALQGIETLSKQEFSEIFITIITQENGITLKNTFRIVSEKDGGKKIEYNVMTANKIQVDKDGTITLPESQYSTASGVAKVDKTGKASFVSGTKTDYDFSNISVVNFDWTADNFENLTATDGTLKGSVKNPQAFFNNQNLEEATDCQLTVSYTVTLNSIKVSYKLENQTINLSYVFTK